MQHNEEDAQEHQEEEHDEQDMVEEPEDPLLIAQTLTYITDDGSVVVSFTSAPFSFGTLKCKNLEIENNDVTVMSRD